MNKKTFSICCIAAVLVAGTLVLAQTPKPTANPAPSSDSRLDKVLEQNQKILEQQDQILKKLDDLNTGIAQLRRRSS
jgi:peptidoglycan hydrolase CwlO-like protein